MPKMLPKRYVTKEAVKRALKIDSFRNLSTDKVMQFASMIPYMDKDVAIAIIGQFPRFAEFGQAIVSSYMQTCDTILLSNKESQSAVIQGYQTILNALSKRLEAENIDPAECKSITEDMIVVADKIALADIQNKKFLDRMGTKVLWLFAGITAGVAAGFGIHSAIGGTGQLPQVDDDDNTNDNAV